MLIHLRLYEFAFHTKIRTQDFQNAILFLGILKEKPLVLRLQ